MPLSPRFSPGPSQAELTPLSTVLIICKPGQRRLRLQAHGTIRRRHRASTLLRVTLSEPSRARPGTLRPPPGHDLHSVYPQLNPPRSRRGYPPQNEARGARWAALPDTKAGTALAARALAAAALAARAGALELRRADEGGEPGHRPPIDPEPLHAPPPGLQERSAPGKHEGQRGTANGARPRRRLPASPARPGTTTGDTTAEQMPLVRAGRRPPST